MKKLIIASVAIASLAFISCNKEKTCTCTTTVTTSIGSVSDSSSEVVIQDGKCSDENKKETQYNVTTEYTCVEK